MSLLAPTSVRRPWERYRQRPFWRLVELFSARIRNRSAAVVQRKCYCMRNIARVELPSIPLRLEPASAVKTAAVQGRPEPEKKLT